MKLRFLVSMLPACLLALPAAAQTPETALNPTIVEIVNSVSEQRMAASSFRAIVRASRSAITISA
jgi:hypothetical protein